MKYIILPNDVRTLPAWLNVAAVRYPDTGLVDVVGRPLGSKFVHHLQCLFCCSNVAVDVAKGLCALLNDTQFEHVVHEHIVQTNTAYITSYVISCTTSFIEILRDKQGKLTKELSNGNLSLIHRSSSAVHYTDLEKSERLLHGYLQSHPVLDQSIVCACALTVCSYTYTNRTRIFRVLIYKFKFKREFFITFKR